MATPDWVMMLPAVNAGLNGTATVLLTAGFVQIKRGRREAHKRCMLSAFGISVLFLACYVAYHLALKHYTGSSSQSFAGSGTARTVYLAILVPHIVLAAAIPILAPMTIAFALKQKWEKHQRLARITFPIWLYVSVTGVIIYFMLYHWPVAP